MGRGTGSREEAEPEGWLGRWGVVLAGHGVLRGQTLAHLAVDGCLYAPGPGDSIAQDVSCTFSVVDVLCSLAVVFIRGVFASYSRFYSTHESWNNKHFGALVGISMEKNFN